MSRDSTTEVEQARREILEAIHDVKRILETIERRTESYAGTMKHVGEVAEDVGSLQALFREALDSAKLWLPQIFKDLKQSNKIDPRVVIVIVIAMAVSNLIAIVSIRWSGSDVRLEAPGAKVNISRPGSNGASN